MNLGTLAYGTSAGASAALGFFFLIAGLRRTPPLSFELAAALSGLTAAVSTLAHLELQSSESAAAYSSFLQGPFALTALLSGVALVWVTAINTDAGSFKVPAALSVGAVIVAIVNAVSPGGVIVDEVSGLRPVSLFGEDFVVHEANRSSWRWVLDIYLIAVVSYVVYSLVRARQRGTRGHQAFAVGMAGALLILMYDSLVDEGVTSTAYLAPFGFLVLTLGISVQYGTQVSDVRRRLLAQSAHLEKLVADRTESLREANRLVVDELERQTANARRVARLTQTFVELNDIAVGIDVGTADGLAASAALESRLAANIESIGALVGADQVRLELFDAADLSIGQVCVNCETGDGDAAWSFDPAHDLGLPLAIGDLSVGRLMIGRPSDQPELTADKEELLELSTHSLAVVVHRLSLVAALVDSAVDDERRRIARDLHDSVSQRLYAAAFRADALATAAETDAEQAAAGIAEVRSLVLTSLAEMRTLLFELQPEMLERSTLPSLVTNLCESMGSIHDCEVEVLTVHGPPVPSQPKLALYRVVQEALGNALRHSCASQVAVSVVIDDGGAIVEVADDGIGFDTGGDHTGHGLWNIAQRAHQVGAALDISSDPSEGTTVSARWTRGPTGESVLDLTDVATSEVIGT